MKAHFTLKTYTISATAEPSEGGSVSVSSNGEFLFGDQCTITATPKPNYIFVNWTKNGTQVSTQAICTFEVTESAEYVAHFQLSVQAPTGAINGLFSVSATNQVWFSKGNLQYKSSTNIWRFATNQWDYIGETNTNISQYYSGWIDLFGWGTSGWNCDNTYYRPWDSNDSTGSLYGSPGQYNLTGSYAHSDWGVHNAISNGGNVAGQWRTLTQNEWVYVFNSRYTSSGIRYAKAQVAGVNGVILLPDDWSTSYYNLNSTNQSGASFTSNVIGSSIWTNNLQSHGAVFLPASGYRSGISVYFVGSLGSYWSASYSNIIGNTLSFSVDFKDGYLNTSTNNSTRYFGLSVRLVQDY